MQLVEKQAWRLCGELQGRETKKQTLWNPARGSPARLWGGGEGEGMGGAVEQVTERVLSLVAVRIKDDTLSTTLKDTKKGSVFGRVSVFSPCLLKPCVGRLPNVVLHTNIDRTQRCLLNPGWGSQWLKLLKEDLKTQEFSSIALEHWPNDREKVLSGLKWNAHHRPCQLCLFGKDRIFFSFYFSNVYVGVEESVQCAKRSAAELWCAERRVCLRFFWRTGGDCTV